MEIPRPKSFNTPNEMAAKPQGQQKLKIRLWRTIKSNKNNWHIKIHSEIPEIFIAFWILGWVSFWGWLGWKMREYNWKNAGHMLQAAKRWQKKWLK